MIRSKGQGRAKGWATTRAYTGRFFANMPGKRLRPRRGGRGWDVEWGSVSGGDRAPFVLPSIETRATTRVPTHPITTPAPTGTRDLLPKKPIPERGLAPALEPRWRSKIRDGLFNQPFPVLALLRVVSARQTRRLRLRGTRRRAPRRRRPNHSTCRARCAARLRAGAPTPTQTRTR